MLLKMSGMLSDRELTDADKRRIVAEMKRGTPNTPKRVETIRRADEVYRKSKPVAGRPPRGDEAMTRRNLHLSDALWEQLEEYAAELGYKQGKPVSVAEAIRQILERAMKRRK